MRIRTKQAAAIGGFVAVLGLAYVLLSTNYGDEVFPGYDQSHLHKCTRNPLLTYPITDRLFEQHDARVVGDALPGAARKVVGAHRVLEAD